MKLTYLDLRYIFRLILVLRNADLLQEPFSLIVRESVPFFDVSIYRENGLSLWERACQYPGFLPSPKVLVTLAEAGSLVSWTDRDGRNILFHCVHNSLSPSNSTEFAALRFLLTVFNEIFTQDDGSGIFDRFYWLIGEMEATEKICGIALSIEAH